MIPKTPFLDRVNIFQGTDSSGFFSNGFTLPLIARPFGMNHWLPQTSDSSNFPYLFRSHSFYGLRLTHQPSPWIGDYAPLTIMPQTGDCMPAPHASFSYFRADDLEGRPDYLRAYLRRYDTTLDFSPTEHCGLLRTRFPGQCPKRFLCNTHDEAFFVDWQSGSTEIRLKTSVALGGVPDNFSTHFVLSFSKGPKAINREGRVLIVEMDPQVEEITLRIGASFISPEQARVSIDRECAGHTVETLRETNSQIWEDLLRRIQIEADEREQKTLYSCFYRTLLFPRFLHEIDASGNVVHYSPYDGGTHPGPMVADNGFWDTHRTVYPLLSLLFHDTLETMLQGWTNAAKEGGWFPRWSSPGYRACMIGTHADAIIADAVVKGIRGFDIESAYRAMLRNAYEVGSPDRLYGRLGIEDFIKLGYLPDEKYKHSVSRTLDYAYNDFCIAQVADYLGDTEKRDDLLRRSGNYRKVWNAEKGFMLARHEDGSWLQDFNPIKWGGPYVEGSAWQCSWAVPHDMDGLCELLGGTKAMVGRLETLLATPPLYDAGHYGREIHEMAEMAAIEFGQYAHSNQPSHHILWMLIHADAPQIAHEWIQRVLTELYSSEPDGFAGDEDNGEMSAWYILASMGIYPLCPGKPEYIRTRPLHAAMRIELANGKQLEILRGKEGAPLPSGKNGYIAHEVLCQGGQQIW